MNDIEATTTEYIISAEPSAEPGIIEQETAAPFDTAKIEKEIEKADKARERAEEKADKARITATVALVAGGLSLVSLLILLLFKK